MRRNTIQHSLLSDAQRPGSTHFGPAIPTNFLVAHQALDIAMDTAHGKKTFGTDVERVASVFGLYKRYTSLPS